MVVPNCDWRASGSSSWASPHHRLQLLAGSKLLRNCWRYDSPGFPLSILPEIGTWAPCGRKGWVLQDCKQDSTCHPFEEILARRPRLYTRTHKHEQIKSNFPTTTNFRNWDDARISSVVDEWQRWNDHSARITVQPSSCTLCEGGFITSYFQTIHHNTRASEETEAGLVSSWERSRVSIPL